MILLIASPTENHIKKLEVHLTKTIIIVDSIIGMKSASVIRAIVMGKLYSIDKKNK